MARIIQEISCRCSRLHTLWDSIRKFVGIIRCTPRATPGVRNTANIMDEKITVELTKQEHVMITALLMMHHTGLIIKVHEAHRPLLNELAQRFSLENIRLMIKK